MKLKYSVSYFVIITAIIIAFVYAFSFGNSYQVEKYASLEEEVLEEETVISNSEDIISEGYYLKQENGYVIVYMHDGSTVFEETDILITELNDVLQEEIFGGKYIQTLEELYSFLENYSS